jgi:hypothetical protein
VLAAEILQLYRFATAEQARAAAAASLSEFVPRRNRSPLQWRLLL